MTVLPMPPRHRAPFRPRLVEVAPPPTLYRIVRGRPSGYDVEQVETADPVSTFPALGYPIEGHMGGPHASSRTRGQPILSGFSGPMWDGEAIRYEDETAFRYFSGRGL